LLRRLYISLEVKGLSAEESELKAKQAKTVKAYKT